MNCPVASDGAMVCAQCFLAKGGSEPREICSNPRCYFYRRSSGKQTTTTDESHCTPTLATISRSIDQATAFVREIGHERTRRGSSQKSLGSESAVWGYRPESVSGKAFRSHVTFSDMGEVQNKARSRSISEARRFASHQGVGAAEEAAARAKVIRARMMSMPLCMEPFSEHDCELVEDAFLSSPLPDLSGGEEVRRPRVAPRTVTYGTYEVT